MQMLSTGHEAVSRMHTLGASIVEDVQMPSGRLSRDEAPALMKDIIRKSTPSAFIVRHDCKSIITGLTAFCSRSRAEARLCIAVFHHERDPN